MLNISPVYIKPTLLKSSSTAKLPLRHEFGVVKSDVKPILLSSVYSDLIYKNTICKDADIPNLRIESLRSVVGPQELKRVVARNSENRKFWVPGERPVQYNEIPDSNGLENVTNRDFGASIHIHTVNSDGQMSVKEVLNQAAEYANEYIKKSGQRFIVGITDHNTAEGCKQAVRILAENPDKYKNLGVVLGSEISTKEKSIGDYNFRKPEKLHILALCLNPFNKDVNAFFKDLSDGGKTPMFPKEINVQEAIDGFSTQKYNWFSLAHPAYPDLKHRLKPDEDHCRATAQVIKHFKDTAKDKALYVENYYASYYANLQTDTKLHNTIANTCAALKLYKAGGIDTHGNSIFYSGNVKN